MSRRGSPKGWLQQPHDDHHDHLQARKEHKAWKSDLGRWRTELTAAVFDYVRRTRHDLALAEFEEELATHESALEIGIEIHEQALTRHERALRLERSGSPGASDGFEEIHQTLDERHAQARDAHERIARRHRAIVEALGGDEPR